MSERFIGLTIVALGTSLPELFTSVTAARKGNADIAIGIIGNGVPYYCILTTAANESMREIHHRMPLVLKREQVAPWLEHPEATREFLAMIPPHLERTSADAQLRLW